MGHVTGQDDKTSVAMFGIDGGHSGAQPRGGILSVKQPIANDMRVGEMDELHSAATGLAQSSHAVPALNTGPSHVKGMSWMIVPLSFVRITA